MIRLRFVMSNALTSRLIRLQAGISMPFTPSHTEALSPDGKTYIGAHFDGGVMARPVGYDADTLETLPDGRKSEAFVSLDASDAETDKFYAYVNSKIGEPYDWKAIFGFVDPGHQHDLDHIICSAFMCAALRACGYFAWPMTVPFHHVSPRDLMLILSTHVEIPH
jgi:hypothetical protein